jgi:DNA-directed RNA polymerase subunit RPC12/RpoP
LYPQLAKEAFGWKPDSIGPGFSKKLKWKCLRNKNHIWEASPNSRSSKNYGCPYCSGKLVLKTEGNLATENPGLAKEAYGWDPKTISPGSNKVLKWKCSKFRNHVWEANVYSRNKGSGCPYCAGQKLLEGFNDFRTTHPKLAKEANGWDPSKVSAGSHKKLKWKCAVDKSHIWIVDPSNRATGNLGCPYCSNKRLLPGYNDLATTHPKLAKEAYGWKPNSITAGSNKILTWRCSKFPNICGEPNQRVKHTLQLVALIV